MNLLLDKRGRVGIAHELGDHRDASGDATSYRTDDESFQGWDRYVSVDGTRSQDRKETGREGSSHTLEEQFGEHCYLFPL